MMYSEHRAAVHNWKSWHLFVPSMLV